MLYNLERGDVLHEVKSVSKPAFQLREQTLRANLWVLPKRAASIEVGGGAQIEEQYVKCGRMRDLYNFVRDEWGACG